MCYQATPLLTIVALFLVAGPTVAQPHDERLKQQLLQEGPIKWNEYCDKVKELQYSATSNTQLKSYEEGNLVQEQQMTFRWEPKRNQQARLVKLVSIRKAINHRQGTTSESYQEEVFCANPKYYFHLGRDKPDAPWVLWNSKLRKEGSSLPADFELRLGSVDRAPATLVFMGREPLTEWLKKPEFRIVRCTAIRVQDEDLVEVAFEYPHDTAKKTPYGFNPILGGTVVLAPHQYWTVRSCTFRTGVKNSSGTQKFTNKVVLHPKWSVPVVKSWEGVDENVTGANVRIHKTDRQERDFYDVDTLPPNEEV